MISVEDAIRVRGEDWIKLNHKRWENRQIDILKIPLNWPEGGKRACVFHNDKPTHNYKVLTTNWLCRDCIYRSINNVDVNKPISNVLEILNRKLEIEN